MDPRFRILVAEDNEVNRDIAVYMLRKLGFASDTVSQGTEVLRALEQTRYDLVLMDCQMPGIDGYEAAREIRRRPDPIGRVPILALTAHALDGDRDKCLAAGMDDYLTKPLNLDDLQAALARWLPNGAAPRPAAASHSVKASEGVRKMGSAGGSPATVSDPPSGSAERHHSEGPSLLSPSVAVVPSGESPDGTGEWPVLPTIEFSEKHSEPIDSLESFDPAALDRLRKLAQATDASLLPRVLGAFVRDAARHIDALRRAVEARDQAVLHQETHTLKGACSNIGARKMGDLCRKLGDLDLRSQSVTCRRLWAELATEFTRVERRINAELKRSEVEGKPPGTARSAL
ncbi:MAG: response regulator [Verrucomicrobia bacterium]|nr:response regulator [Verrucomicrobiota bacterium]